MDRLTIFTISIGSASAQLGLAALLNDDPEGPNMYHSQGGTAHAYQSQGGSADARQKHQMQEGLKEMQGLVDLFGGGGGIFGGGRGSGLRGHGHKPQQRQPNMFQPNFLQALFAPQQHHGSHNPLENQIEQIFDEAMSEAAMSEAQDEIFGKHEKAMSAEDEMDDMVAEMLGMPTHHQQQHHDPMDDMMMSVLGGGLAGAFGGGLRRPRKPRQPHSFEEELFGALAGDQPFGGQPFGSPTVQVMEINMHDFRSASGNHKMTEVTFKPMNFLEDSHMHVQQVHDSFEKDLAALLGLIEEKHADPALQPEKKQEFEVKKEEVKVLQTKLGKAEDDLELRYKHHQAEGNQEAKEKVANEFQKTVNEELHPTLERIRSEL